MLAEFPKRKAARGTKTYHSTKGEGVHLRKSLSILAIVIGIAAITAPVGSADPAVVFNHGNNPGDTCFVSILSSEYTGWVTFVSNDNGGMVHCTVKLTSGPGVLTVVKGDGYSAVFAGKTAAVTSHL